MASNSSCLNIQQPVKILGEYQRIVVMEANGDCPVIQVSGLVELLDACIAGDLAKLRNMAAFDKRSRVKSAASFILRRHEFESACQRNMAT